MVGGWTTGSSLVGRGEELAAFDAALEHARGGDPVTVLLGGEAGIGKTRLVDEFSGRAFAQGARLLSGACVDLADAALPYGAVVDALRAVPVEAYEPLAPAVRRELAALVPEAAPDDLPYDGAQGGLFGALLRLLEQLGREEPLVLVLEDLHWADPSTRDLVSFLARGLRQTAVLLVVTYRTDEIDREHPVRRLLASLQRAPGVRSWDLGPMTREETARHLAAVADTQLDAEVVDAIHRRSEGNPFFAEELLAARDRGTLSSSLRDALLLRLDRLSAAAQGVVRVAATVGRDVDHELLREVAELPDDALDLALRECVDAHVLRVDAAGRGYRFRHALLQEVAAEELLPGERRRLHERIADRLQAQPPQSGAAWAQRLAELAHHRLHAHDLAAGLVALVQAARAAEEVHALSEASRAYDGALDLWEAVAEPETLTGVDLPFLLERVAECRWLGRGDASATARLIERALAELDDDAPALRRADLLSRLAMTTWESAANAHAGLPLHEQALGLLDGTPSEVAARVRTRYANMLLLAGEFGTAEREAIEAVRLARAVGALLEEADALVTQFVCRGEAGDILRALQLAAEARPPVLETCDARIVRRYFTNLTWILHCFGRYEEAVAVGLEGIDLHVRAGLNRHGQLCMQENAAGALCALGRPREAAQLLGDGEGAFSSDTISIQEGLATIAMLEGDLAGVSARLAAVRAIPGLEALFLVPACATDATAALLRGDADSAIAAVRQGEAMLEEADRLPATQLLAAGVWALADAAEAGVVDVDAARAESDRLLTRLRDVAAAGEGRLPEPDARVLTGEAERSRLEPLPDAVRWRAAAAAWEALARPFDAAYARWREAQALANARGPRAELEHALSCAHASAKVVGTPQLVERIEQLARRSRVLLPGMRDAGGGAFPDLTPREREVLALVAEGRTNREIAQALFITDKTASVHVSNILGKLGAANRGEAAALAHSAGFELELSAQA